MTAPRLVLFVLFAAVMAEHGLLALPLHGPSSAGPSAPSPGPPSPPAASTGSAARSPSSTGGARRASKATTSAPMSPQRSQSKRPKKSSGANTGATGLTLELNALSWEFWWEHNRDSILAESASRSTRAVSGSTGELTGRGRRHLTETDSMRQARERIIPVLQEILRQEHEAELCDSATLALARVAAMDHARTLPADISRGLRHETLSVKTSATLSLGVLGDARALPLLNSLMTDSSSGRNAIGDSRVPWQIRAYAALSLGLINDQLAIEPLIDSVLDTSVQDRELRVAAVSALGLMDNEARQSAVAGLLAIIKQRDMDPVVQAHAITSIGHLGDRAALPCLLDLYREPDTDDCVLQSVAIAFGRLGMATDSDVIKALTDAIEDESDASCRQFGLIALARIGMSQDPANVASADPEIGRLLRRQVSHPTHRADRGWAALGTALHARSAPASERQLAVDVLSDEYEDTRDPSVRAALALALGLVDASSMAPTLLDDLLDSRDDAYRGYAAVGLGLLKYKPAAGAIVSMCTDSAASDTVRLQAARALGLMRDPDLAPVLVKALSETASLDLAWSLGRALGQLRDPASVDPLIQLIEDNHRSVLARAFSCVAIGLIGEKRDLRFNTAIQEDYNYAAPVAVLNEVVNL